MKKATILYGGDELKKIDIYNMLKDFNGYGNFNGKYWFVGMEENWNFDCDNDIRKSIRLKDIEYYSHKTARFEDSKCEFEKRANSGKTFERGIKKIILEILEPNQEKIDQILFNNAFITNSTFIPINKDYIEKKIELFETDLNKYRKDLDDYRTKLKSMWSQNEHITFCLSSSYIDDFFSIFGIDKNDNLDNIISIPRSQKNGIWQFTRIECENGLIFVLYHPSYPSFDLYIADIKQRIVEEINEYSKNKY